MHLITAYVILATVAAAIVAIIARPSQHAAVREMLVGGTLSLADDGNEAPSLEIRCLASGRLILFRRGLTGVADDGACSLAITFKGSDINIEERITPGRLAPAYVLTATFNLGYLREGYYHIRYNSAKAALWTAFTLHTRPGLTSTSPLHR